MLGYLNDDDLPFEQEMENLERFVWLVEELFNDVVEFSDESFG